MSTILGISRGSVKQIDAFSIKESVIHIDGISSSGDTKLVSNFKISDREKLGIIQCFNDTNHLYAFGHDPENSGFGVTYIAFMGKDCMESGFEEGSAVKDLVGEYNAKKVSTTRKTVVVTFAKGCSVEGVVTSMEVDVFSPELNALTITIAGKVLRWNT